MPGDDDDHSGRRQACPFDQQAMQAGDADVVHAFDRVPISSAVLRRFLGDRKVGGSGVGQQRWYPSRRGDVFLWKRDEGRIGVIRCAGNTACTAA